MKRALSFTMAALMAFSSSVCVYAEGRDEAELRTMLSRVKSRIEVPAELEEFDYRVSTYSPKEEYTFTWYTSDDAETYKAISCTICSSVITNYSYTDADFYSYTGRDISLAALSADELYSKAVKAVKMLNPTVAGSIEIDKDSLSLALSGNRATFQLIRTKNDIPVNNDGGRIVLDKDTGELISFNINWHPNAAFRSPEKIIPEEKAKDAYENMIAIYPEYEIYFDGDNKAYTSRIVYRQADRGEINAFTGKKSNFVTDGYFGDNDITMDDAVEEETTEAADKNMGFTEAELKELNKELPFATEADIVKLMKSDEYMSYNDGMALDYSRLYKTEYNANETYVYTANFSAEQAGDSVVYEDYGEEVVWEDSYFYESVSISVNAETGEIISYSYYNSDMDSSDTFDEAKTKVLAEDIAEKYAGERFDEYTFDSGDVSKYTDKQNKTTYYGSWYSWDREVNKLDVRGDYINVGFNAHGVLTEYRINYSDVEFASPDDILSEDEIMDIFWQDNELELYYLARVHEKITKTVLVYGTDGTVYRDAFTGKPVYNWDYAVQSNVEAIKDKALREKAEILEMHGLAVTNGMEKVSDGVKTDAYADILNRICAMGLYGQYDILPLSIGKYDAEADITVGDAMVMLTAAECGTAVPSLGGIFKSPYTDVKENDKNIGYYAIAHALLESDDTVLGADEKFTYSDMIDMIYDYLAD